MGKGSFQASRAPPFPGQWDAIKPNTEQEGAKLKWAHGTQYILPNSLVILKKESWNKKILVQSDWCLVRLLGIPRWHSGKESTCQCKRHKRCGFNPRVRGKSLGVRNGNPLQYSCLENSMERETWQATVHRVVHSRTWLSAHTHTCPGLRTMM